MEPRHASLSPRPLKEEPAKVAASRTAGGQDFAKLIGRLLDEFDASDFRSAERILDAVQRHGRAIAGFPRIRPNDCDRAVRAMQAAFEANYRLFVTGDLAIVQHFGRVLRPSPRPTFGSIPAS